jgi:hypothetical protein
VSGRPILAGPRAGAHLRATPTTTYTRSSPRGQSASPGTRARRRMPGGGTTRGRDGDNRADRDKRADAGDRRPLGHPHCARLPRGCEARLRHERAASPLEAGGGIRGEAEPAPPPRFGHRGETPADGSRRDGEWTRKPTRLRSNLCLSGHEYKAAPAAAWSSRESSPLNAHPRTKKGRKPAPRALPFRAQRE